MPNETDTDTYHGIGVDPWPSSSVFPSEFHRQIPGHSGYHQVQSIEVDTVLGGREITVETITPFVHIPTIAY